ncbi:DUF4347 domain-containing protein, partial [Anabaena sp. CCY 9910]|uniref:DUF4347 domain-containing protein n=1 Tax=Anabaena sp. CCY 9910 TaxID=3103870 RepID=UPI0039E1FD20
MNLKLDTQTRSTPASITSSIVFIDTAVTDYESLIAGVKPGNQVFILDPNIDGVEQITRALQGWEYNSVHIVSHGSQASLQLGSTWLNAANLDTYTTQLQQWRESLSTNAEILLYGCQVASGEQGMEFVRQLHLLTGANIAASQNLTGSAALGGDWQLQASIGVSQPQPAFSTAAMTSYAGVLNLPNDTFDGAISLRLDVPVSGATVGAIADYGFTPAFTFAGIGQSSTNAGGNDVVYSFIAPTTGTYSFRVRGLTGSGDPVLYAVNLGRTTAFAGANRNSTAEEIYGLNLAAGENIYLVVDQTATTAGRNFEIEVNRATLETEPNNTPGTANTYVFGIQGSIGTVGDADFFSLGTPSAGSRVFAFIDGVSANSSDFDLRITTAADTLEYDDSDADSPFASFSASIAGTPLTGVPSYIRVNHFNPSTSSEPYRLYAVVQPELASATVEIEGNDSLPGANSAANNYFSGALSSSSDVDLYSFTANAGDLIFLSADFDPLRNNTPINGALALLDSSGTSLITVNDGNSGSNTLPGTGNLTSTTPASPSEGLVYRVRTTGTYYARVTGNAAGDYLLSIRAFNTGFSVNDAPFFNNTANVALTEINEDVLAANNPGTLVSDIIGNAISDPNPNALRGIAVTSINNSNGIWQYTINSGTTWNNFGSPSLTAARLLPSNADTRIRLLPNANFNGNSEINFYAWDQTTGTQGNTADLTPGTGGSTAYSTAFITATITVNSVNDTPTVANTITNQTTTTGTAFNFQIPANTFADGDPGDTLTYTATLNNGDPLPSWLSFNAATGTFTGIPRSGNAGNLTIRVTAIDSTNLNVNTTFDLSITFSENIINGNASNNTFIATDARDVFTGDAGYDNIITNFANFQQNDSFNGGDGRDAIIIQGGANTDTITFNLTNP